MALRRLGAYLALFWLAACGELQLTLNLPAPVASVEPSAEPASNQSPAPPRSEREPEATRPIASAVPAPSLSAAPSPEPPTPKVSLAPEPVAPATSVLSVPQTAEDATLKSPVPETSAEQSWIFPTPPPDARSLKVARVVDGDTLHLESASGTFGVRLIGVDTPETVHPTKGVECFGPEASAFTKTLAGQTVKFGADPTQGEFDRYDRALGYIWFEGRLINQELIVRGLAREYTYSKPYRYQQEFRQAQSEAQAAQAGIWSDICSAAKPTPPVTANPAPDPTPEGVEVVAPATPTPAPEGSCGPGEIWVKSYTRKDGTVVRGYCRRR